MTKKELFIAVTLLGAVSAGLSAFVAHRYIGDDCGRGITVQIHRAEILVAMCEVSRLMGKPISGTPAKPMTMERANEIVRQLKIPRPGFRPIVSDDFSFGPTDKFPEGWGEKAPGIFDNVEEFRTKK